MRKNNKLAELACRFWPRSRRRYEEMCVLAITGQLGGPQMAELDQHIAHCQSCRKFLDWAAQASVQTMSVLADKRLPATYIVTPEGMRARVLSRAAAEGSTIESHQISRLHPIRARQPLCVTANEHGAAEFRRNDANPLRTPISFLSSLGRLVAFSTIAFAIGIAGYYGGRCRALYDQLHPVSHEHTSSAANTTESSDADISRRISRLEEQKTALAAQSHELAEKLAEARAQKKALVDNLSSSILRLAEVTEQSRNEQRQAVQEKRDAANKISSLEDEINRLRGQLAATEAKLTAQQQQSEELETKLEGAESDLARESALKSARREVGDLVAARNLHIIDVYDVDNGKRQHSFGRVFYVEGESLVFYVYDLEDPHHLNTNVVFRVWGEKSGMNETTHSLGILHNDDASPDRWTLRFDDPKVLAQINAVFVTVEAANKHYNEPRGKKVLYAYFGSNPNHL